MACAVGNLEAIKLLISQGLDMNYDYKSQGTKSCYDDDVYKNSNYYFDNDCPLKIAISTNNQTLTKYLLDNGANTLFFDKYDLDKAVDTGNLYLIEYYLNKGADINKINLESFQSVFRNDNYDTLKYLSEKGFNLSVLNDDKSENALFISVNFRQIIIVNTQTVTLPQSTQALPQVTTSLQNLGTKALIPAPNYTP